MRHSLLIPAALVVLAAPAMAAPKPFKETKDYRDSKTQKGYLNIKFDTYSKMFEEPDGTDVDWAFVDPSFDIEDLRKSVVSFFPDSIGRGNDWAGYWGMAFGWYSNPLSTSFESALNTVGVRLNHMVKQNAQPNVVVTPYGVPVATQAQAAAAAPEKMPELSGMALQIEKDRYEEDKKNLGVEEAAKRSEAREAARKAEWEKGQTAKKAEEAPKNPEDMPGYVLVLYLTESKVNTGAAMWVPFVPVTNTTTGEFVLLKDGKPVLAARHNSVGAYTGSAPKCGAALATAFGIKKPVSKS